MKQDLSFIPIYHKLKEFYKERILNQEFKSGQKIDSINKIMLKHKVSRETAKLVLRQLIEEGLIISKQGKGSFVVHHATANNKWGMIIPFYSSNIEQLIHCLEFEARRHAKELTYFIHYNNPEEEMRLVSQMIFEGFEAVLVVPNYDESLTAGFYRKLMHGHTSVILVDFTMSGSYFKYVVQSYDLGIKRAVQHLVSNTAGNLVMIKSDTWKGRNLLGELMEQTFLSITESDYADRKVFVVSDLKKIDRMFFINKKIGGILTSTDTDAIRVLGRLKKWGIKIPEQARLVSYGNTELTLYNDPAITVVDCKYEQMAMKAADLIELGQDAGAFEQHIIEPELIIRKT
ncbi:MAG: substrate-binding domain-containing protein [Cytophagales bacterium]|nr:substrate-binding domain-containing protein [Cytophagales bacterium]